MSGIIVNYILLMLSATVFVEGLKFFFENRFTANNTRLYILFYSIFSSLWCLTYGIIGVTENLDTAALIRVVGIFSINGFLVVETFLVSGMSNADKRVINTSRIAAVILALVDTISFSNTKVDLFYRLGNWTTWGYNSDCKLQRSLHSGFVAIMFGILFSIGLIWVRKNKYKRNYKFIRMVFTANFLMLFFTIPDTFFPQLGKPAIATSGIGAAACTFVILYGATQLNYFDIKMGNVAQKIYSFIDVGVMVFDLDYRLSLANPYAHNSFPDKNIEHVRLEDLFKFDNDGASVFEESMNGIVTLRMESLSDGKTYSTRASVARDTYNEPYCYIFAFIDVTEEINMMKELEIANNAKTMFLTSVSHEIRTPLNAVLSFNEIIRRNTTDPEIISCSDNINMSGELLLSLIGDLLDMGKISSGKMELLVGEYKLAELIKEIYILHKMRAENKGLILELCYDMEMPGTLEGDKVRIQQIVTNLLSNAIKYTNQGKVRLEIGYDEAKENLINLIIRVSDTGTGIKESDIPHIFDAFRRFDEQNHRHVEGIGVGMSITKNLVDLMGGNITVTSQIGSGSSFCVTIPQKMISSNPVGEVLFSATKSEKRVYKSFSAPEGKILVVDDNDINLSAFTGLLKHTKMKIDTVSSGAEALELIKKKQYNIIFMDHMMPELSGIETLHLMKNNSSDLYSNIPVIVMTANAVSGAREEYLREGFTDYISKPIDVYKLEQMIRDYLPEELVNCEEMPAADNENIISFPAVEGVDWSTAYRNIPDRESLLEIIGKFVEGSEEDVNFLQKQFDVIIKSSNEKAMNEYRIRVHAMKNSAAVIGAPDISEEAKKLEYATRDHDLTAILENHAHFVDAYKRLAEGIIFAFGKEGLLVENEAASFDKETLRGKLDIAKKAMEEIDTVTLNDLCFELSKENYPSEKISLQVQNLCNAFRDFDENEFFEIITSINRELDTLN